MSPPPLKKPELGWAPNFSSDYSVVIDAPLSQVWPILAPGDCMEPVVRLYDRCVDFAYLERDIVARPSWSPEPPVLFSQHAPPADTTADASTTIPRQFFRLYESVTILPGVVKRIEIDGAQVWDDQAHVVLYESRTAVGVFVWKFKKFEEEVGEDGKKWTRVSESIRGECPWYMKMIVQSETRRGHKVHMEGYQSLFK